MEDVIILQDVSYAYFGQIMALKNVSLSVRAGELFCIIGQNGSGKTTLLHIINALIPPDSGQVLFKGSPLTKKSLGDVHFNRTFRQSVGYIFQNPDIQLFCPTVYDELLFGPLQTDMPIDEAHDRACQTLDALGINDLKHRPVSRLSGGEKKKVAIASVLTMNPDVLLIDEPLAGLDPKTQTFFIELLIKLNQAGKTVIFTTHHLDLIDHLQPRVAVLSEDHTIQKTGSAAEILTDEEFLVSVNLIHEHVHRHGEETHRHFHSHYVFHRH
ncbi:MAG: ABC transporter ATP-binding protein [Bacteroidetes bacterium]|nr:ABC transporter ATP-binding protein [Bacteroidota bacterium]